MKSEIVNVDQWIHFVEQVINFLRGESEATYALVLALLHKGMADHLQVAPGEIARLAGVLMSNPDFRAHLNKVAEDRLKDRNAPGHLELVKNAD